MKKTFKFPLSAMEVSLPDWNVVVAKVEYSTVPQRLLKLLGIKKKPTRVLCEVILQHPEGSSAFTLHPEIHLEFQEGEPTLTFTGKPEDIAIPELHIPMDFIFWAEFTITPEKLFILPGNEPERTLKGHMISGINGAGENFKRNILQAGLKKIRVKQSKDGALRLKIEFKKRTLNWPVVLTRACQQA